MSDTATFLDPSGAAADLADRCNQYADELQAGPDITIAAWQPDGTLVVWARNESAELLDRLLRDNGLAKPTGRLKALGH